MCPRGLSAVNAIGTQLRDPVHSGLARWRLTVYMDAVIVLGVENEWANAGRDGRNCLSRDLVYSQAQMGIGGNIHFPTVQLTTSRIGNRTRLVYEQSVSVNVIDHVYHVLCYTWYILAQSIKIFWEGCSMFRPHIQKTGNQPVATCLRLDEQSVPVRA